MPKRSRTFWLARRGHNSAEYEDAFAADEVAGRFAVADGAPVVACKTADKVQVDGVNSPVQLAELEVEVPVLAEDTVPRLLLLWIKVISG